MIHFKVILMVVLAIGISVGTNYMTQRDTVARTGVDVMRQLDDSDASAQAVRVEHWTRNQVYSTLWTGWALLGLLLFLPDIAQALKKAPRNGLTVLLLLSVLPLSGCRKPYEPVHLETISPSEEGFLIPYIGDGKKQASTNNEEYLKANLVPTKQVRIPQQWIQTGYDDFGWSGHWEDSAKLIKVDKSPVTREWTADPNSGTSNKNEAVWVMTSDQVEFSTGWTCTARIQSRDDAVRFLHNYPAGGLKDVMDTEVRSKLQAVFGLEVTDLPMETLRTKATPHILKTVAAVTDFFKERGITITNLGITGGFVYKDPEIMKTMVKVFTAEQEKSIAAAANAAQTEKNKQILSEADCKAQSVTKQKQAEADGVKTIADAKAYEISKAKEDLKTYIELKRLEIELAKLQKWDGKFPQTYMGKGSPDTLLQVGPIGNNPEAAANR